MAKTVGLTVGLTQKQLTWVSQHDWFVKATCLNWLDDDEPLYKVQCNEVWADSSTGESGSDLVEFTDFAELYAWAGY